MAQQTINLGAAPDDGTGDTLRAGGDKINDNFDELYDETLKLKGSTDCSTNPNYPAASKADSYRVSVAGKIGGASGIDVEIGDFYYALADNAGGTQAAVGSSWDVLQGNTTGTGGSVDVEDEGIAVAAATVLNFTGAGVVATDAGGGQVDVTIAGGGGGVDIEDEGVAEATGATVLNFTGAGVTATDVGAGQVDIDIPGGSGSAWALAGTGQTATGVYDFAVDGAKANVDFVGLVGANEIMVLCKGITLSVSGIPVLLASVDNGSTFPSSSGDYVTVAAAGTESNSTGLPLTSTSATAARTGLGIIQAANVAGTPKNMLAPLRGAEFRIFVASTDDVDAVRLTNQSGGNITGGKIYCLAR